MEWEWMMRILCLLAGVLFGSSGYWARGLVHHIPAGGENRLPHRANNTSRAAPLVTDTLKTALACGLCYGFLAPELKEEAILYAGAGVVLGHLVAEWKKGTAARLAAVVCTWIVLYLPITGVVCTLAGLTVALGTGRSHWGMALVPALAIPVAWLQFGWQSSLFMLAAFLLLAVRGKTAASGKDAEKDPAPQYKKI